MKNLKFYASLLIITTITLSYKHTYSQTYVFESIQEFGHYTHNYMGNSVSSYFYIGENISFYDCSDDKTIRIGFIADYAPQRIDHYFDFEVTLLDDGVPVGTIESGGIYANSFNSTSVHIYQDFTIENISAHTNGDASFVIDIEKVIDIFWFAADAESDPFTLKWNYLPTERAFTLNGTTVSAGSTANEEAEIFCSNNINGELLFALNAELTNALYCQHYIGSSLLTCTGQHGGLKITRTNAAGIPTDDTRYLGTSGWLTNEYSSIGSSFKEAVEFSDCWWCVQPSNGNPVEINLLEAFNDYMLNNLGFYLLEFEYFNECGSFTEELWITFNTTPDLPVISMAEPTGGSGYTYLVIPGNTTLTNPFITCGTSSTIQAIQPSYAQNSDNVNIIIERFANSNPSSSEGEIFNTQITWQDLGTNYRLGNKPPDSADKWSYEGCHEYSSQTACDNLEKYYKVTIEFENECGVSESFTFYFSPSGGDCKTNHAQNEITEKESIGIFKTYPNPSTNEVSIELKGYNSGNCKIEMYDYSGRKVLERKVSISNGNVVEVFDISTFSKGVYLLKIEDLENNIQMGKLIIE